MANSEPSARVRSGVFLVGPAVAAGCLMAILWPLFALGDTPTILPVLVVGVAWTGQLWYVNYAVGAKSTLGRLGLANALTILRGALYAVVAGFVVVPAGTALAWVPAACYGAGVLVDRLDGAVARTVGRETELGRRLDMAFDTFGFAAAPLVAVLWGLLPAYYLVLSAARYVFVAAVGLHRRRGGQVHPLPDSDLGKYLAGGQMAFVTVALAPPAPTGLVHAVAPVVLAPSLAVFARDYLYATGRLGAED
ncbi:CDP-alcohol phosphatidyltransferase family protein [Saliphagus infecundisoli]|uniref:CDP-alcohol phosphatidyltransferase family protein n=1 Tax=Saliphagus infecundisoli TaxID=1849069 RepID=A0ABD5QG28_9EURY|nr:CDP-alcohol phosphatidyltransferase family protein [Saliphagus infecundisoli]